MRSRNHALNMPENFACEQRAEAFSKTKRALYFHIIVYNSNVLIYFIK